MLTYIVYLLDKYNKIYKLHGTNYIKIMFYFVMGVRGGAKGK
jgi:hypothetical protein